MRLLGQSVGDVAMLDPIVEQAPGPSYAIQLGLGALVLVIGWYASKLVVRLAGRTVARRIERPSVTRSVLRTIRLLVLLVTVFVAALILGVGNVEILLSVGVISAVVAVVLAPLIGSFINGVFILTDRPFEIGDMIEVTDEGHRGFVEDITIRYTKIFTLQNTFLVIPNSEIHERDVVNLSAEDERTRIGVEYEITYESDLDEAIKHAQRGARSVDAVIGGGPDVRIGSARYTASPTCHVDEYADDGIRLILRFWVSEPYKLTKVRSEVLHEVKSRYGAADVEFAYPHRQLVLDDSIDESQFKNLARPGDGVAASSSDDSDESDRIPTDE